MYLSKRGRAYRDAVAHELTANPANLITHDLTGRLHVVVTLHRGDRRAYDVDNYAKSLLDAMQHCEVFQDDGQIDHLEMIRGEVRPRAGCVIVEITETEEPNAR